MSEKLNFIKKCKSILAICFLMIFFTEIMVSLSGNNIAIAQEEAGGEGEDGEILESTKGDILIVTGAGLGGAILGLSTLSFVEEPKKHTRNIIVGAAIGIMAGVGIVAYMQASKSTELFYQEDGKDGQGQEAGTPATYFKSDEKFKNKVTTFHWDEEIASHQIQNKQMTEYQNDILYIPVFLSVF